jgi:cation/acetate symporter
MDVQGWTLLIVGLSFALYIGIAIWARAGSTKEFYVAGGGVSPLMNGMATAADWMSAASFISMAGLISFMGYDGGVYLMGWTGGYVLLALLLAPYLRKFGKYTVPDFIGDRYYSNTARTVAVICALIVSFTYVAGQMRGVGVVFSRFLEVDIDTGVIIGMGIVFFYAVLGGMKGITYTQVAQYCVLIFAYMVPAIFISLAMTGNAIPQLGFIGDTTDGSGMGLLDKLDSLHRDLGFAEYTSGTKSMADVFAITFALMVGTAGLPHVIVRFFTVPRVKDARSSAGYALAFIAILYTTAPAVAAFARTNLINTVSNKEYKAMPEWFSKWEETGLIKFEDKNKDGLIQYVADAGVNELTIDNDIIVLANPEIANLPAWVIALVAAGGLAAALSTAAGLLLVISTSVSRDLIKMQINPNVSEKSELMWARIAAFVAVLIAGYFGIHPPGFVAAVVALAFGLAAASFFPAIIMGIFDKRMNMQGAVSGMIVGISLMMWYMLKYKFGIFDGGKDAVAGLKPGWWFGISPEGFGTIAGASPPNVGVAPFRGSPIGSVLRTLPCGQALQAACAGRAAHHPAGGHHRWVGQCFFRDHPRFGREAPRDDSSQVAADALPTHCHP